VGNSFPLVVFGTWYTGSRKGVYVFDVDVGDMIIVVSNNDCSGASGIVVSFEIDEDTGEIFVWYHATNRSGNSDAYCVAVGKILDVRKNNKKRKVVA
jgi:hypothetical protein